MTAAGQTPGPGKVFLDHVGWFVHDMDRASAAFTRLGFTLTPFVEHNNAGPDGGPGQPTGTGNRCAMLETGYLEVLTSITGVETALAEQLRAGVARYTGLHLIAFSVADADAEHGRLEGEGFGPLPAVHLRRPVETEDGGAAEVAFSVVRLPPGTMAEGRVQLLTQDTPEFAWQERFITRANGVTGLDGVLLCVDDPADSAGRFARFVGREAEGGADYFSLQLDRGRLGFATPARCHELMPRMGIPCTPFIAALGLTSADPAATMSFLARQAVDASREPDGIVRVPPLEAMGATLVIHADGTQWPPAAA